MISYNALKVEGLREVLETVATACNSLDIDFFIVGAVARNIWYIDSNTELRGTKDIDFGVYVRDAKTYSQLKNQLIDKFQYKQEQENAFCLISPNGKAIDLMPFGQIANDTEIIIEGSGMTTLKLEGFEEVFKEGSIETEIEGETYKACSIPGIVILKLIAYDDRPDRRIKDIIDINTIFKHYSEIETEMIYDEYNDLYDGELSHHEVGLIVLGSLMKKILRSNTELLARVTSIIEDAINEKSDILEHMITDYLSETLEDKAAILNFIRRGLKE